MKRSTYIKPEIELVQIEEQQMIAASNFTPESGDVYEGDEAGTNKRRGTWGNLWSEK